MTAVHNHPPHRPPCNERTTAGGALAGACQLKDGERWPLLVEAQAQLVRAARPPQLAELVDPVLIFAKLVREVEAGQVLVRLAIGDQETRLAALDALALARDVLDDARGQLDAAAAL